MRLHVLTHVAFENAGMIGDWARKRGHSLAGTALYDPAQHLPEPAEYDLLVVMGGPMSVNDEAAHSWLAAEKAHIRAALEQGKHVFGVCLGAQLIAAALGARVYLNEVKEIGWFPVRKAAEHALLAGWGEEHMVFHWHGETFDLPKGAEWLLCSAHCRHQAFLAGRALGLQFHLEMAEADIARIIAHCEGELGDAPTVQQPQEMTGRADAIAACRARLFRLLDDFTRS